jgi:hypothetical protein
VPLIVGAVVVVGGGIGAAIFLKGGNAGPSEPDSATIATGNPPPANEGRTETPGDTQRFGTQGGTATPAGGGRTETATGTPARGGERPRVVPAPMVEPAGAAAALDLLQDEIDRDPVRARDSALVFYNAAAVSNTDKAMAAFVIANTYWKQGDRPTGCGWIARARNLDPATRTYVTVAGQCQ